ncbi:thioredoxin-domain-containing protein [Ophiobolus disseminans]|uniref:Thioredoxin-domain-containing protein n=1 Tax=Ophiobolus disseminans TaxID=1469910 RepID=A0A6A7A9F4_9PLEO|nr:thioredoxin-domain-containing protein [Ophiobolus disseminans]
MFAPSSLRLTRSVLTSPRLRTAAINPTSTANLYRPHLTPKFFTTTNKMSERKQGVHNLQSVADYKKAMEDKDTFVVLDCFATWCGPCKMIAPTIVKFSEKYPETRFYKLDIDEVPEVAKDLGIRAMPTFVFFKNGEKVGEVVGANPKAIEAGIQEHNKA